MITHHGYCLAKLGIDDRLYAYINIPKNASSFTKIIWDGARPLDFLTGKLPTDTEYVIVLRDPLRRWLSGVAEAIHTEHELIENINFNEMFDQIVLDDHTAPQVDFLAGLDYNKVVWFKMEDDLQNTLLDYVKDKFILPKHNFQSLSDRGYFNRTQDDQKKRAIVENLKVLMKIEPELRTRIEDFFKDDYELYNNVQYYSKEL